MKIIGWNINPRLGFFEENMLSWLKAEIKNKDANIIVLTKVSPKVPIFEEQF